MTSFIVPGILLSFGLLILASMRLVEKTSRRESSPGFLLNLGYWIVLLSLLAPAIFSLMPQEEMFRPVAQVWAKTEAYAASIALPEVYIAPWQKLAMPITGNSLSTGSLILLALALSGLFFVGIMFYRFINLHLHLKSLPEIRRLGRITILASSSASVPFSAWSMGRYFVVLPVTYLVRPGLVRVSLAHEFQHIRAGDIKWLFLMEFLRMFYFWNPLVHLFVRRMVHLQEESCDRSLLHKEKVTPELYGRQLLEAAQMAVSGSSGPALTASLARSLNGRNLERRIRMIYQQGKNSFGRTFRISVFMIATLAILFTAFAAMGALQDKTITMKKAQELALHAQGDGGFEIVVNRFVLEKLNRYLGTTNGRKFIKAALKRRPAYNSMIHNTFQELSIPTELEAVALVESGFNNILEENGARSRGMWQFIPSTARKYGLRVDEELDERLDIPKATAAAGNYLQDTALVFDDWHLAVASYNMGESHVMKKIIESGTRNPWELMAQGHINNYLAAVMAGAIILGAADILDLEQ